jgi:hypothetical protein
LKRDRNRPLRSIRVRKRKNIIKCVVVLNRVKWVRFHHGMARPQVVDRGNGPQIWRVAVADRGLPSSFGVVRWANNPPVKKIIYVELFTSASEANRF